VLLWQRGEDAQAGEEGMHDVITPPGLEKIVGFLSETTGAVPLSSPEET
jgi:hypothetical protein